MANWKKTEPDPWTEPDTGPEADGVGYRHPPLKTRFRPGQSGNPGGRPRGAEGLKQIVARIANEMHRVLEDGRRRRRSTLQLICLQLRNLAAQGNVRGFQAYHKLLARYSPEQAKVRDGYLIVPEQLTLEEWELLAGKVEAYQRGLAGEAEEQGLI
jgi:Family of unknown function (DUF5681)